MQNSTCNSPRITGTAMLAAVATVLMYLEFPIPIMPAFVKLDVSELPALIASFAYGRLPASSCASSKTSSSCPAPAPLRWASCLIS